MSKITKQLSAIGIHNIHGLVQQGHPIIYYSSSQGWHVPHWAIQIKGKSFKNRAWYEHGCVWMSCNRINKNEILQQALDAVKKLFPDIEMVKSPFGDYAPKCDIDEMVAKAKEASKTQNNPKTNSLQQ